MSITDPLQAARAGLDATANSLREAAVGFASVNEVERSRHFVDQVREVLAHLERVQDEVVGLEHARADG